MPERWARSEETARDDKAGRRLRRAQRASIIVHATGTESMRASFESWSRAVKEQLVAILDAIRAAQCTLGRCRQPNVTVEQLRDILCNARVDHALKVLSPVEPSPPMVPEDGAFPHDAAAS